MTRDGDAAAACGRGRKTSTGKIALLAMMIPRSPASRAWDIISILILGLTRQVRMIVN